jgi:hypothetical protein
MFDYLHGAANFLAPMVTAVKLYQSRIGSQGKPGVILTRQGNFTSMIFRTAWIFI